MPYHNPQDGPVIIAASVAFFRFPADSYSPAIWDDTLESYAATAGLVLVLSVPDGAVEAEINRAFKESTATVHVDLVEVDVDALIEGIAGGVTQAQLAAQLSAILSKIIVAPATEVTLAAVKQALLGSGLPVPLAFADPGSDAYTAAIAPGRACTRLRVIVGNSGVVISLDDGTTDHYSWPPNTMDDVGVSIPADTKIKVKRYTAGVPMTDLIVGVQ